MRKTSKSKQIKTSTQARVDAQAAADRVSQLGRMLRSKHEPTALRAAKEILDMAGGLKPDARTRRSCEARLMRLIPYNVWLATAGNDVLHSTRLVFGSPRAFYQWFRAELERGAGLRSRETGEPSIA